jgi:hypothetical protein
MFCWKTLMAGHCSYGACTFRWAYHLCSCAYLRSNQADYEFLPICRDAQESAVLGNSSSGSLQRLTYISYRGDWLGPVTFWGGRVRGHYYLKMQTHSWHENCFYIQLYSNWIRSFSVEQATYGHQLHVESIPCELYVCISRFSLLSKVPRKGTFKNWPFIIFLYYFKHPKRKWNDQNLYLCSVLPNNPLVVERFLETMELWHV